MGVDFLSDSPTPTLNGTQYYAYDIDLLATLLDNGWIMVEGGDEGGDSLIGEARHRSAPTPSISGLATQALDPASAAIGYVLDLKQVTRAALTLCYSGRSSSTAKMIRYRCGGSCGNFNWCVMSS
jgi:hypothetical protein